MQRGTTRSRLYVLNFTNDLLSKFVSPPFANMEKSRYAIKLRARVSVPSVVNLAFVNKECNVLSSSFTLKIHLIPQITARCSDTLNSWEISQYIEVNMR